MRVLVIGLVLLAATAQAAERPNVLFILTDDLGWGDLKCYGNPIVESPNIDKLAKEGLLFTNFYVNGSVCSPSRVGFTTGRFPGRFGVHGHFAKPEQNAKRGMPDSLDPTTPTIARAFKDAGYVTGHIGKWHMGVEPAQKYGFDESFTFAGGGPFHWEGAENFWRYSTEHIVDEGIAFLERNKDKPFYLNLWTFHPHAPLDPSEEHMKPYQRFNDPRLKGTFTTPFAVFYGTVTEMDKQFGRLLDKLDELGQAENTIVLFSSDNGPEDIHLRETAHSGAGHPGPFRGRKRSLYEGGIRTPFIVRWPGHTPGGQVDSTTVVSGVDFLPTLCAMTGVEFPAGLAVDGEDMSKVLFGEPQKRGKPLMWEFRFRVLGDHINRNPQLAMREGDWKLLMNPDGNRVELYNIVEDPSEVNDRTSDRPDVVERMSTPLLEWQRSLPEGPVDEGAGDNTYPWPK